MINIEPLNKIPIEYFKWGTYPDHFIIDMPHRHEFVEFIFFTKGGGFHEINFTEHTIRQYSIHIIPASAVHFLKRGKTSDGFTIAFDKHFLDTNAIHRIVYPLENKPFVINLSEKQFEYISSIVNIILMQVELNKGYYKEKGFLLAMELLINAIAQEIQHNPTADEKRDRIVSAFKSSIQSNIHKNTSVKFYADALNISAKYLSNHLKEVTNKSAKQWILESLIISVKKQLINTDFTIKQIAYYHGYNESSLSKLFKKHVGYTMTEYRSNKDMSF